jgi:Zn-dependent peptidase ImmA (M78 family)
MIKFGWIKSYTDKGLQAIECFKFYNVHSVDSWHKQESNYQVAFKAYDKFDMDKIAIQTWLKKGEIEANAIHCNPFDKYKLESSLGELRALTLIKNPNDFFPKLTTLCADCGVAVVLVQTPKKCPMGGATKWISPNKALLMLSARGKNEGSLWFSFFHELGHILKHNKENIFLEGYKKDFFNCDDLEKEADKFASEILIPAKYTNEMKNLTDEREIVDFSNKIGISSGVVVGRMQFEKIIPYYKYKDLQTSYKFK